MEWERLLSTKRLRELAGGAVSTRANRDARNEFARDYGRLVFSTPVRRLLDKTQVFPLEPNDSVRTRLMHSIEVASVAQHLAESAAKWLFETCRLSRELFDARALSTIASACALVHDIGNPPFGHAGELAIQEWAQRQFDKDSDFASRFNYPKDKNTQRIQDFLRFEGNAQTIRLLSKLQVLIDFHGLNLTCATLSAACKYTASSDTTHKEQHERRKPGYFLSETEVVTAVREETGTGGARNPITYLVEAGDDVVYSAVDLEDGVRKGLLRWEELRESLESSGGSFAAGIFNKVDEALNKSELPRKPRDHETVQLFRTFAIGETAPAALDLFKQRYDLIVRGEYHEELLMDADNPAATFVKECKTLARKRVYSAPAIVQLELMGRRIIQDLMTVFWEAASIGVEGPTLKSYADRSLSLISENYRNIYRAAVDRGLDENYARMQLVTDQISGMTDNYACALHKQLSNG